MSATVFVRSRHMACSSRPARITGDGAEFADARLRCFSGSTIVHLNAD